MQWWEVNRYLAGLRRRYHPQWETTRALQWWLACMFSDRKHGSPPASPGDLYRFGWEKDEAPPPQMTEQDAHELQQLIDNHNW